MFTPCTTLARGIQHLGDPIPKTASTTMPTLVPKKKPKQESVFTDPDELQITNDPIPVSRCVPVHKYHDKFSQMKIGQCIRCTSKEVGKVAGALRKFVEIKGSKCDIKTMMRYENDQGYGRVWLMPVALKKAA